MSRVQRKLSVSVRELPALTELAQRWRELEARCDNTFFLSWQWIGCWLKWLPSDLKPLLVEVCEGNETVALAILIRATQQRARGFIRTRSLHLHATGREHLDLLTIEHNGVLAPAARACEVNEAILAHLLTNDARWDEWFLDGIDPPNLPSVPCLPELAELSKRVKIESRQVPVHYVDLDAVRRAPGGYLSCLGRNTRYQLRASARKLEQQTKLQLDVATSTEQALDYFDRIKSLNERRFASLGVRSSFTEPQFVRFHRALITQAFGQGHIELLRIRAGETELGYLYNFLCNGRVLCYQFGTNYEQFDEALQPGMVAQRLAIERAASNGHKQYSLLAGDALYKRRLSTAAGTMLWSVIRRPRLRFKAEGWLRRVKQRLTR